jgi:hypothetical protein
MYAYDDLSYFFIGLYFLSIICVSTDLFFVKIKFNQQTLHIGYIISFLYVFTAFFNKNNFTYIGLCSLCILISEILIYANELINIRNKNENMIEKIKNTASIFRKFNNKFNKLDNRIDNTIDNTDNDTKTKVL